MVVLDTVTTAQNRTIFTRVTALFVGLIRSDRGREHSTPIKVGRFKGGARQLSSAAAMFGGNSLSEPFSLR